MSAQRHDWLARVRARHPRLTTFIARRLDHERAFGLRLTIGLALSLGALWLLAAFTEDVVTHDTITLVDMQVATWFRTHATAAGDRVGLLFSDVGSPVGMGVLALVGAAALALARRWLALAGWIAAFVGAGVITWAMKIIIHRPRPPGAARFLHQASFSFPSGHALGSLVGFGMLAYVLIAESRAMYRHRVALVVSCALLALAIGLSRLYLVVHYLSDVVAGYAAGAVWLAACITAVGTVRRRRRERSVAA